MQKKLTPVWRARWYAAPQKQAILMVLLVGLRLARFGVRVNAIAPGYLDTELDSEFLRTDAGKALIRRIPQRRVGRLEELDGPLLLLASEASSYMTGLVIVVDGGPLVGSL